MFATENLRHDPTDGINLHSEDPARPWRITYELSAHGGGRMAWLAAYALIQSRKPDEACDNEPARIEIAELPQGPWRTIAESPIEEHPKGWHFGLFAEGRLSGESDSAYVQFSARKGAKGFRIIGHYAADGATCQPTAPLEIEHTWYEEDPRAGRRLRSHVERTQHVAHEYVVHCASQPHNERITLRVPSVPK